MAFSTVKKGVGINLGLLLFGSIIIAILESSSIYILSFSTLLIAIVLALLNFIAAIVTAIVKIVKKDPDHQLTQAFLLSSLLLLLVGFSFCLGAGMSGQGFN